MSKLVESVVTAVKKIETSPHRRYSVIPTHVTQLCVKQVHSGWPLFFMKKRKSSNNDFCAFILHQNRHNNLWYFCYWMFSVNNLVYSFFKHKISSISMCQNYFRVLKFSANWFFKHCKKYVKCLIKCGSFNFQWPTTLIIIDLLHPQKNFKSSKNSTKCF